jgi:hypothetical protein
VKRWDTVEDRLYKIRNCMNIEGVERTLALYSPPISPALLVAAAAAGVDISSVLSDLYSPLPYYRFQIMLQKALEFCAEVRALGSALLSALEKEDAEELALVRASQESQLLSAMKTMKEKQVDEAEGNLDALNSSKEVTQARGNYYTGLVEDGLNDNEQTQLDKLMTAQVLRTTSQAYDLAAQIASLVPDASVGAPTCTCVSYGGSQLGPALRAYGSAYSLLSDIENYKATTASIKGGYDRRSAEWEFQITSATKELAQLDKQIAAAQLRVDIANEELTNHNKQVENAAAVYDLIKNKYTNQELYSWMVTQISALYFQSYQLAYNLGKRAERCYQHELAVDTTFIQFGYWDSLKKGLLAGERLQYDLRRMDAAYLENNKRTFELTKHVSLIQLDPVALLKLKETGECYVSLPEAIFDLDYAGHYQRRIKSVSLTIPCVTGPYSTLSCTLTLLSSSIRTSATANANGEDYSRNTSEEDARFKDYYGATQSIATSHGRQDSGLFELSFHDERYLPFEGGGVISQWRLELPTTFKAFDYSTISDVILHIQYTAKDGGSTLKSAAGLALEAALEALKLGKDGKERTGLFRAFSLRHEFPNEWYKLLHPTNGSDSEVTLTLDASRFPYRYQDKDLTITTVEVYVKGTDKALFYLAPPGKSVKDSNGVWDSDYEIELGTSGIEGVFYDLYAGGDQDVGEWTLAADEIQTISDQIEEIILVFGFTVEPQ